MADRFYSLNVADENVLYVNYTAQQQKHQQQQQPHFLAMGQAASTSAMTDFDFLARTQAWYYASNAATTAPSDINNNNAVSYYQAPQGHGSLMTKFLNTNGGTTSNIPHITSAGMLLPPHSAPPPPSTAVVDAYGTTPLGTGCQYALANGSTSCYNRNRYTPYNHNRACATAGASHMQLASAATPAYPPGYQPQPPVSYVGAFDGRLMTATPTSVQLATTCASLTTNTNATVAINTSSAQSLGSTTLDAVAYEGAALQLPQSTSTMCNVSSLAKTTVASTIADKACGTSLVAAPPHSTGSFALVADSSQTVTLQITNLDYTMDEPSLRNFLLNQLWPITPVVGLVFEGNSYAKVTVPDLFFAKQVVSNLHRKKVGHKRMLVSYTRDSSLTEFNTLRCQVAGLLKDVPFYMLPMYKFRELFQSRFKTSISVLDLYKMPDICTINTDTNEEKFICLQPELVDTLESSPLMEGLQHSVPYCTLHFKREQHKGWAEQEIEPLPNVSMTISEIQQLIYPLLKTHAGDIPVASLLHCIEGELNVQLKPSESGVNLEHLVCCVQGIQIQVNNFGIKILGWLDLDKEREREKDIAIAPASSTASNERGSGLYANKTAVADSLYLISREVIELVKMSPKATMKFNRFIPAYHNHFGKQCRVADYGYTKLIELFEALSAVVQIMGDGENRQITLTHRTQIRRFTSDLLRVLRAHGNKSVLLSQLPIIFAQTQYRSFDVTDYGVCDIADILDGLVHSNVVMVNSMQNGKDLLISIPRRKQTAAELEKTSIFAGEMVELFGNAPQYAILFQKFVRSYHYHFAYQCRLSDYGFLKLADLMEAIQGVVEMEMHNDEDRKVFLSPRIARRVFAEQCAELIRATSGAAKTCIKVQQLLELHKKKYGYQMLPQTLGVHKLTLAFEQLPYVELIEREGATWISYHGEDALFRKQCYRAIKHVVKLSSAQQENTIGQQQSKKPRKDMSPAQPSSQTLSAFLLAYNTQHKELLTPPLLKAMRHAVEIYDLPGLAEPCIRLTILSKFLLRVVRCLEQHPSMYLVELKQALDCNITSTFDLGYPNLYTLLISYPDLFTVKVGASQERSEVSLTLHCELRNSGATSAATQLYSALRLPTGGIYVKPKAAPRLTRAPLGEQNGRSGMTNSGGCSAALSGPTPAKTRALSNDNYRNANCFAQPTSSAAKPYNTLPLVATYQHNSSSGSQSIFSMASQHSSSLLNSSGSNKENSACFNTSLNLFNSSFNSSSGNCSFEPNSSLNLSGSAGGILPLPLPNMSQQEAFYASNKLWERRQQQQTQQQQHYQQQLHSHYHSQLAASSTPNTSLLAATYPPATHTVTLASGTVGGAGKRSVNENVGLYDFVSNMQKCPNYEPPKPDTPPSENMPFWIDPIWTNNNSLEPIVNNELLNIKLPEMKSFNVLPMLLSPYTLSKTENMKQQVFNFENHDRKIA